MFKTISGAVRNENSIPIKCPKTNQHKPTGEFIMQEKLKDYAFRNENSTFIKCSNTTICKLQDSTLYRPIIIQSLPDLHNLAGIYNRAFVHCLID